VGDIDDIRAKLRSGQSPVVSGGGQFGLGVLVVAACAIAFGAVLLLPELLSFEPRPVAVPLQPSAAIPTFRRVGERDNTPAPEPPAQITVTPATYAGKSAREIGKIADEVCFRRAHARHPNLSKTPRLTIGVDLQDFHSEMDHFNELMHCLLTEGTQRYCSAGERRMIVAEIAMYFRGIAFQNRQVEQWLDEARNPRTPKTEGERRFAEAQKALGGGGNDDDIRRLQSAGVDPDLPVIVAIESRLRDGLLTKANRDEIATAAPPEVRTRLARIQPPKSKCPDQPWWAFWR
jgi:hypothetical protein